MFGRNANASLEAVNEFSRSVLIFSLVAIECNTRRAEKKNSVHSVWFSDNPRGTSSVSGGRVETNPSEC